MAIIEINFFKKSKETEKSRLGINVEFHGRAINKTGGGGTEKKRLERKKRKL